MQALRFDSVHSRRQAFSWLVLALLALRLPRALWPEPLECGLAALAWLGCFIATVPALSRFALLSALTSGVALLALSALAPPLWFWIGLAVLAVCVSAGKDRNLTRSGFALALGIACPALFYAAMFAIGPDQRNALGLAFHVNASISDWIAGAFGVALLVALTVTARSIGAEPQPARERRFAFAIFGALAGVIALRFAFISSVASLPTDLLIWSEPPALVNLLKISAGLPFYGPFSDANSYSYSPGLELFQYSLLRPFHWQLSLRAHRALGSCWQFGSALVLAHALWPWLGKTLREVLNSFAAPALILGLAGVTFSSLLAPHVHPDHLLLLCFSVALGLCLRADPFQRRDWLALALVPIIATVFKLTGAGIGLGLLFVVASERRRPAFGVLLISGLFALLTIPLFDATLGNFSAYAIRLQASHPIDWQNIALIPRSASATIFGVAVLACLAHSLLFPSAPNVRAARRVLILTSSFGLVSLSAFLKHGGRENSLMPLALGGACALLVLSAPSSHGRETTGSKLLPVNALFWLALSASWFQPALTSEVRRALTDAHEREIEFLRDSFARGAHPWSQGTAAWIAAGRRDVPLDRLTSASELDLGHRPELHACEDRLIHGDYNALFLSARARTENPFLHRIGARLDERYRVAESQFQHSSAGYTILELRAPQNTNPPPH